MAEFDLFNQPPSLEQAKETQEGVLLSEAREYVLKGRKEGVFCPCCKQLAKIYKRSISHIPARMLIELYIRSKRTTQEYFHVTRDLSKGITDIGGNDFHKLVYWGLILEKPKNPEDTKTRTSGYWMITKEGEEFVLNRRTVTSHVLLYDSQCLGFEGRQISIKDCLRKYFNYEELMNEFIHSEV